VSYNETKWYVYYAFKEQALMEQAAKHNTVVMSPRGVPEVQIGPFSEEEASYHVSDIKSLEGIEHAYKWPIA
jgi:hypothetical protein